MSKTLKAAEKRQMLEAARDNYLRQAYEAEIQIAAIDAQPLIDSGKEDVVVELSKKQTNALAAAGRMEELLRELHQGPVSPDAEV